MDLVAIDVHGELTAGSAPPASDARFSSRHCKGAPAMPFPLLKMARITTSPINCFTPVGYWQNTPKLSIDRQAVDWNRVVLKSALWQSQRKVHAQFLAPPARATQRLYFGLPARCDACHFILNGAVRNSALAGRKGRRP
jgi:hypothetical protein